jgi:hypothetical protein
MRGLSCLLALQCGLGLGEAVDEDGEDDVHHDEAREEGPRDEVGRDANLFSAESASKYRN